MLSDLTQEQESYLDNMTLLLADMKEKWKDDLAETGRFLPLTTQTTHANKRPQLAPHSPHDGQRVTYDFNPLAPLVANFLLSDGVAVCIQHKVGYKVRSVSQFSL